MNSPDAHHPVNPSSSDVPHSTTASTNTSTPIKMKKTAGVTKKASSSSSSDPSHVVSLVESNIVDQMTRLHTMLGQLISSGVTKKLTGAHLNYLMNVERLKFNDGKQKKGVVGGSGGGKIGGNAGAGSTTLPMAWFHDDDTSADSARYFDLKTVEALETETAPTDEFVRPAMCGSGSSDWRKSLDLLKIWKGVQARLGKLSMSVGANKSVEKTADAYVSKLIQEASSNGKGLSAASVRAAAQRLSRKP